MRFVIRGWSCPGHWLCTGRAWIEAERGCEARPAEATAARPGPERLLSVSGTELGTTLRDIVTRIVTFVTKIVTHCDTGQSQQHYLLTDKLIGDLASISQKLPGN